MLADLQTAETVYLQLPRMAGSIHADQAFYAGVIREHTLGLFRAALSSGVFGQQHHSPAPAAQIPELFVHITFFK